MTNQSIEETARAINRELADPNVSFKDAIERLGLRFWETRNALEKAGYKVGRRLVKVRRVRRPQ